ncbi:MAG: SDR family NAD(P)-dependent oxidoreductase [Prevotellaceae bacterium]|jgi:short-subunit dehydrogenase|nr:SDR family NAD(P)-dependent oxidoreductase [Prevotellaceae bacterium]
MRFKDKIVWITGASSGIGEATAFAFIEQGATVIASSSSAEKLEISKAKAPKPEQFNTVPLDLGQADTIESIVKQTLEQFGRVDILINNAGISQRSLVLDTPITNDRKVMEIDYFGTIILTKAILPQMIRQGGGHILCTSSIVGVFGFPLRSAYSAAKHALHGFFESLRLEYYKQNIKVGIIIGGRINTAISMNAITSDGSAYGKLDDGQKNGINSEKAARQILRGIRKNKREIRVGGKELLMVTLKRRFPRLHFFMAKRVKAT